MRDFLAPTFNWQNHATFIKSFLLCQTFLCHYFKTLSLLLEHANYGPLVVKNGTKMFIIGIWIKFLVIFDKVAVDKVLNWIYIFLHIFNGSFCFDFNLNDIGPITILIYQYYSQQFKNTIFVFTIGFTHIIFSCSGNLRNSERLISIVLEKNNICNTYYNEEKILQGRYI